MPAITTATGCEVVIGYRPNGVAIAIGVPLAPASPVAFFTVEEAEQLAVTIATVCELAKKDT